MAGRTPFSAKDAEGIRRVASFLIGGGTVRTSGWRTVAAEFGGRALLFAHLVNLFLTTVDREYGTIMMLPYGEPLMEHPEGTRTAWLIMQDVLLQKIVADRKAATPKGLSGARGYSGRGKVRL